MRLLYKPLAVRLKTQEVPLVAFITLAGIVVDAQVAV